MNMYEYLMEEYIAARAAGHIYAAAALRELARAVPVEMAVTKA